MARNVPNTPTNQYTPNFTVVNTTTGFSQGDMVYQNNGDFTLLPGNAVATAAFSTSTTQPYAFGNNTAGTGGTTKILAMSPNTIYGGSYSGYNTAVLSNGNVVRVGVTTSNYVYFTVTDATNTTVVSPTVVSSSLAVSTGYNTPSVAALAGGGFAVAWPNSSATTSYAVYTNTGSVTLAATTDSTLPTYVAVPSAIYGLPNGTFVIASSNNGGAIFFRIYTAAGAGAYATASYVPASANWDYSNSHLVISARSDSSFIILSQYVVGTTITYAIFSSNGTQIVNTTFSNLFNGQLCGLDVSTLSDGTTFVIGYSSYSTSYFPNYRFLPTGNVLSGATSLQTALTASTPGYTTYSTYPLPLNVFVKGLASGNFILGYTDFSGAVFYAVFNSSGTCVSGFGSGTTPFMRTATTCSQRSLAQAITVVEYNSTINLLWCDSFSQSVNSNTAFVAISQTTWDPVPLSLTYTQTLANQTVAVSGIVPNTQTPQSAKFYAANTATTFTNNAQNTYALNSTVVASEPSLSLAIAVLSNGYYAVGYINSSTYAVSVKIYNQAGTLQTTLSVGFAQAAANYDVMRITALTGGGFVVSYISAASTITHAIYTSSYVLSTTFNQTSVYFAVTSVGFTSYYNYDVASITGDRFVVAYYNAASSNQLSCAVYNSSGTLLTTVVPYTGTGYALAVCGIPNGGFGVVYNQGSTQYFQRYSNPSGNTFTAVGSAVATAGGYYSTNGTGAVSSQSGTVYSCYVGNTSANSNIFSTFGVGQTSSAYVSVTCSAYASGGAGSAVGLTAYNEPVYLWYSSASTINMGVTSNAGASAYSFSPKTNPFTLTLSNPLSANPMRVAGLYGRYMLVAFNNSSNYPCMAIVSAEPWLSSYTTTAGVTQSNTTSFTTPDLAGISASPATAGGSGVLQTNGTCQVNSSYSSTTPYTNFTNKNAGAYGVDGYIVGRNVSLIGNI